jgi:signal peptidase II
VSALASAAFARLFVYRWLLLLAALVLLADRLSKAWITAHLPFGTYGEQDGAITVIPRFFYLVNVGNTGAAWSLFSGHGLVLAGLAAATLAAIFIWRKALELHRPGVQIGFGLLCGGIVGNLIDRLIHGHVIDFIDLHFGTYIYPTFNVADSGICVGVALYVLRSFIPRSRSVP